MGARAFAAALPLVALFVAPSARAQDRPPEEDIFGGEKKPEEKKPEEKKPEEKKDEPAEPKTEAPAAPALPPGAPPAAAPAAPPPAMPPAAGDSRDDAIMGTIGAGPKLSEETAPDNPLIIGGQFYLRAQSSALEEQKPQNWIIATPTLLDAYFDARPNPRVRGFVLGRMQFDAIRSQNVTLLPGGFSGVDTGTGMIDTNTTPEPRVKLDQLWLRFDIKRTVFVTAGRQHVRWGTGRFWTPTDFLHVQPRNPLDVFDVRLGSTMLKLHIPWESRGWNFYAYGVTEGAGPTLGTVAGAARAEVVLGASELGLGAMVKRHRKPRLAADLSFGLFDIDFYGEAALRYGSEIDRVGYVAAAVPPPGTPITPSVVDAVYPVYRNSGIQPQVTGGFSYSRQYADKDVITFGGEYFYNALGYDDPVYYLGVLPFAPHTTPLSEPPNFFYLGRHYAALFVAIPAPYSWDLTSFTLSTLGNLSDGSFISRIDYALTLLTHLRFEAFASLHYGTTSGEFRLGIGGRPPALLDLGVALRVSL